MTSTGHPESRSPLASQHSKLHRLNVIRDALAGALLLLGLLLPWNLEVGITIGLDGWILTVLLLVTSGSLAALAFSHVGPRSIAAGETPTAAINLIRQWCNVPYFVVAGAFAVFALVQFIGTGGTVAVPPGIGPGLWFGLAGALLAAQPVMHSAAPASDRHDARFTRPLVVASLPPWC